MPSRHPAIAPDAASLLTVAQVGVLLQLSPRALRRIPADLLPAVKIGRCRRYRRADVVHFISQLGR